MANKNKDKPRREKGSGQITEVPNRKSPFRASVVDSQGKQKSRFFKTRKEAQAFLRDINANSSKLKTLIEKGVTYEAFSQVFLDEKKKSNMKASAYKNLAEHVERTSSYLGKVKLGDIDSDLVQQMVFSLAEKGYSASVMVKAKSTVGSVLKMAAAKHYVDTVPVFNITIPRAQKQDGDRQVKNNWLRTNEMAQYVAECQRTYVPKKYTKYAGETLIVHPAGYKLLFILHTGLRLGEALALTWNDYDEDSKTLMIDKNTVYIDGKKITQTPKTESGERLIILNRQAVNDLEMLRKQFDEQTKLIEKRKMEELRQAELKYSGAQQKSEKKIIKEKYDAIDREHKYICGASSFPFGSSGHSSTLQTHHKICKAIGLSHSVNVHGLRHTFVTHYYLHHKNDPDFDLATFSRSIGHSSVRTTMEVYAHLDMTENRYIHRSLEDLKDF